jgi:hypothetical protein
MVMRVLMFAQPGNETAAQRPFRGLAGNRTRCRNPLISRDGNVPGVV